MLRSQHVRTQQTEEKGGGLEKSYAFFSVGQRQLYAVVGFLAHSKENAVEQPLHELPQKDRHDVFSTVVVLPLRGFDLLYLFSWFFPLTLVSHPSSPPCNSNYPLCFYSGSTMNSPPMQEVGRGGPSCILGREGSCDVLTEVASHKDWHTVPPLHFSPFEQCEPLL